MDGTLPRHPGRCDFPLSQRLTTGVETALFPFLKTDLPDGVTELIRQLRTALLSVRDWGGNDRWQEAERAIRLFEELLREIAVLKEELEELTYTGLRGRRCLSRKISNTSGK